MEDIEKYIYTSKDLDRYLQENRSIVIYGVGVYGKRLIDYMISSGNKKKIEAVIATEKKNSEQEYRGIEIQEAALYLNNAEHCFVIVSVSLEYQEEIVKIVKQYHALYSYMTLDLFLELGTKLDTRKKVPYHEVDFLLPGFTKCGTSSLHRALRNISSIYLSEQKESWFFLWQDKVKNSQEMLIDQFFDNIREGQTVGMIEPVFWKYAKEVYEFFGDEIKIIFLIRNPVTATFSRFKMHNREGASGSEAAYQKTGYFYEEMFEEYFKWVTSDGVYESEYIYWIEQFWKYYTKEQVKIVFFEELINNTKYVMNDILNFIGISDTYKNLTLPLANEGNFVMADEKGYKLARIRRDLFRELKFLKRSDILKRHEVQGKCFEIQKEYEKAHKIYNLQISNKYKNMAELYFFESVRKLESALEKDLSELWF